MSSRQDGQDTAEAVLEAAWAITNLAAGQHDVVKTVLVSAPALIAHLSGWLGNAVADQCAWALGDDVSHHTSYQINHVRHCDIYACLVIFF